MKHNRQVAQHIFDTMEVALRPNYKCLFQQRPSYPIEKHIWGPYSPRINVLGAENKNKVVTVALLPLSISKVYSLGSMGSVNHTGTDVCAVYSEEDDLEGIYSVRHMNIHWIRSSDIEYSTLIWPISPSRDHTIDTLFK